jgi:alpha-mannosidase
LHHEEVGAVIKAKYLEEGGHYAKEMSRVDHLSLNHFADISSGQGHGVTVSVADCLFMKLGKSEEQKLDSKSPQINVLIGGQIDKNFNLGITNQGGDSLFQQNFALIPHAQAYDQTQAMKFSLEHQNPLRTSAVTGGNDLPPTQYSYLNISDPSVLVWSLKPSETSGTSLRVWNMGNSKTVSISFDKNFQKAGETTHVETEIGPLSILAKKVNLNVKQQEMKTIKVE